MFDKEEIKAFNQIKQELGFGKEDLTIQQVFNIQQSFTYRLYVLSYKMQNLRDVIIQEYKDFSVKIVYKLRLDGFISWLNKKLGGD